jgi:hypothetical protein
LAGAENDWIEDELVFIDQALSGQVAHQAPATENETVAARRSLEPCDRRCVGDGLDDSVFPVGLREALGEDDLLAIAE